MPTIELQVYGRVQGVFFRAGTREKAAALGLTGWVRNMPDGSVLLQATGPDNLLQDLETWCKKGPERAEVLRVDRREVPERSFEDFRVIR